MSIDCESKQANCAACVSKLCFKIECVSCKFESTVKISADTCVEILQDQERFPGAGRLAFDANDELWNIFLLTPSTVITEEVHLFYYEKVTFYALMERSMFNAYVCSECTKVLRKLPFSREFKNLRSCMMPIVHSHMTCHVPVVDALKIHAEYDKHFQAVLSKIHYVDSQVLPID